MNEELLKSAREVIGDFLRQRREEKGLSRYRVMQMAGWLRIDPIYVSRIEDNYGNVITDFAPQVSEVFSESTYLKMLPMMCDVIDHGTGIRLRYRYGIKAQMGGKTGTTNARPAPPTTTPTVGSWASHPRWPPACGWAVKSALSISTRWPTGRVPTRRCPYMPCI